MPPKPKLTKEAILSAALDLVREEGADAVNARNVAKKLNCSTQPIFSHFASMEELKAAVQAQAEQLYNTAMMEGLQGGEGFLGMGLAYIRFARTEKRLFQLLFMSGAFQQEKAAEIAGTTEGDEEIIRMIAQMAGLSRDQAQRLYSGIWFTTHGIASLLATNGSTMDDAEANRILRDVYKGILISLKQESEDTSP
ncbi:TetR/AcrR family transcriptional regulator [Saccharibacillus sacchari]|uniref:TetR/AcrR family transcriptional regulator n=1 Tax=Saccharibacillus sacchari TaxID=456493 RepID=UPI0004ADC1B1|nr:TetR/AcrR family transcriptional regulator [Saccharibacillus sacchari]